MPNITWTKANQVTWHHTVSLCHNELIPIVYCKTVTARIQDINRQSADILFTSNILGSARVNILEIKSLSANPMTTEAQHKKRLTNKLKSDMIQSKMVNDNNINVHFSYTAETPYNMALYNTILWYDDDKCRLQIRRWTYKWHPIACPWGQAMACLS